jgi:anaerobic selenocysteine-containing dehydrogenase
MDWDEMECITLIGSHIGEDSRNTVMQDFIESRSRGAQVIVVDPRFSSAAAKADYWLPIKPGTDTALLLAWVHVLITEDRFDRAYIDEWATGFDELAGHVQKNTPVLSDVSPVNELWINEDEAAALGYASGDSVGLENDSGDRSSPMASRTRMAAARATRS